MDLTRKISRYIARQGLFHTGTPQVAGVLVGLSGGPDSVALLHLLHRLGYVCHAVHVNFHLRGEESDRDEAFARRFCASLGVPCHVEHLPAAPYAAHQRLSIEMAARELRYSRFETLRRELSLDYIAVGHHRDDNIETFFLNLLRGSGSRGLSGMRPQNGCIVRPLLCLSHHEILAYLESHSLSYITDSSNLQTDCRRNRIRLQVVPLLESILPSAPESIARSMELLSEADTLFQATVKRDLDRILLDNSIKLSELDKCEVPQGILHSWLFALGFNGKTISDIYRQRHDRTGRRFTSPSGCVLIDRGVLKYLPAESGDTGFPPHLLVREISVGTQDIATLLSKDPWRATLDADKVQLPLSLRHPKPGDRFVPFGMHGSKTVSDFLTDRKVPRHEKGNIWVAVTPAGEIVWIPGHRVAAPYAVTSSTRTVLEVGTGRQQDKYRAIIDWFSQTMPDAATELHFGSTFQLLVAVILSAQCTDKRVNMITPALFKAFPDAASMACAGEEKIYELIRSVSYPHAKSKHLLAMSQAVVDRFGGEVPHTLEELLTLPGVGRKTANVMLICAFDQPAMPVDTHVFRVSNRIGLTKDSKTPEETERILLDHFPKQLLGKAHHWLILHGRYTCQARRPHCETCGLTGVCDYFQKKM